MSIGETWSRLTGISKGLIVASLVGVSLYGVYTLKPEWLQRVTGMASTEITGIEIPTGAVTAPTEQPTTKLAATLDMVQRENVGTWRHIGIAWNGQIGLIYANGGVNTASGSLMDKAGISMNFSRQDDYNVMAAELLKFAEAFAGGDENPTVGVHSVTIMGDAGAAFLAGLQPQLDKLGLHAKIIGATGRSLGEDKCMGQPNWADTPSSAKGGLIAGVLRDGDWNICMAWAQTNGIKVNPDAKTYDPEALNFYATSSFTEADSAFINGLCEERPVVTGGKATGETKKVCVAGTATWTPGDVNVVEKISGTSKQIVNLLTTRENAAQMFSTIIVIDEWAMSKPNTVTNFLQAGLNGAATVANDRGELRQAAALSAKVWGEQDADYWEKYYYGVMVKTPNTGGREILLGGSQALGLASNLQYFLPAGSSVYDRVYQTFGDLSLKLYPDLMPEYPKDVINPFFLQRISSMSGSKAEEGAVFGTFDGNASREVASRSYAIQFAQGSAQILPSSLADLNEILNNAAVGSNLAISVEGHTSSEGSDDTNQSLSEARAKAVRQWLIQNAPAGLISANRIDAKGFGEQRVVKAPSGAEDMAASRRVEIRLLGS